ncbi:DUF551 domain-containing protein [Paradesulfitobacterium aromaticivorans]
MNKLERLTARSPKNNMVYLVNVKNDEQALEGSYNTLLCVRDAFERLALYEETGLSPDEVAELAKGKTDNCWISVSEQLPEEYTMVLVSDGDGIFRAEYMDGNWHGIPDNTGFITESITHWRPLPEPPESEIGGGKVGKKRSGRLLDGREWDEIPEVQR